MEYKSQWRGFIRLKCDTHACKDGIVYDPNLTASRYRLHRAVRAGAMFFSQELPMKILSLSSGVQLAGISPSP